MLDLIKSKPAPRTYIVFDLESVVTDQEGHARYQRMERFDPQRSRPDRRSHKRASNALVSPRWCFQSIVAASAMRLTEHPDGNLEVAEFRTWSRPLHDEPEIVEELLQFFADAPAGAELASWSGAWHDIPILKRAALTHGCSLPGGWEWLAWGGEGRVPHIDLCRILTGGAKIKLVHMSEYAAAAGVPAKLSARPFSVARLARDGRWAAVQEMCEGDVLTTALLLARWRRLLDSRASIDAVEDRIVRQVAEKRPNRTYVAQLQAWREERFQEQMRAAHAKAAALAPWLKRDAA
jgi:hypothetical protein